MNEILIFPDFITDNLIFRLLLASILGGIIGVERDIHGRAAGLRTNLLVSLGAATFIIISLKIPIPYLGNSTNNALSIDPGRIAAQIVTGIGFIGAGAIIKNGFSIRGLTTAACLWIAAAIGMSSGAGYFELAIIITIISLFSLIILNKFERIFSKDFYRNLEITMSNDSDISYIISTIKRKHLKIIYLDSERDYKNNKLRLIFTLRINYKNDIDKYSHQIMHDLENIKLPIYNMKWIHH